MFFRCFAFIMLLFFQVQATEQKEINFEDIGKYCENATEETLFVIDANACIVHLLDTAFIYANENPQKQFFDHFLEERKSLDDEQNYKIDHVLLNSQYSFESNAHYIFDKASEKKAIVLVVFDKSNKFVCGDKILQMIATKFKHAFNFNYDKWHELKIKNCEYGILASSAEKISEDIEKMLSSIQSSNHRIKNIVLFTNKSHEDLINIKSIPCQKYLIANTEYNPARIDEKLIARQCELLKKYHQWYDDFAIKEACELTPKQLLLQNCKRLILDVCPCSPIDETAIYARLHPTLKDSDEEKYLLETMDDFQEIRAKFRSILDFVVNQKLDRISKIVQFDPKKLEQFLQSKHMHFKYEEAESHEAPFKIIMNKGCGIQWKDALKFKYCKKLMHEKINEQSENSYPDLIRQKRYEDILIFITEADQIKESAENNLQTLLQFFEQEQISEEQLTKIREILFESEDKDKTVAE